MSRESILFLTAVCCLTGCGTVPMIDIARASKCVTEVATKESKFTCEFEGQKVFAKK